MGATLQRDSPFLRDIHGILSDPSASLLQVVIGQRRKRWGVIRLKAKDNRTPRKPSNINCWLSGEATTLYCKAEVAFQSLNNSVVNRLRLI